MKPYWHKGGRNAVHLGIEDEKARGDSTTEPSHREPGKLEPKLLVWWSWSWGSWQDANHPKRTDGKTKVMRAQRFNDQLGGISVTRITHEVKQSSEAEKAES